MPNPYEVEAIPRRVMPLIFMVDTSGSMGGSKIASLNTAVREALNDVGEISKNNADAQIKVAALEFSSGASWMYDQLIEAESFQWQDLTAAGLTSFGAACDELNQKLSKSHGWMSEPTGTRAPAIILLSDGEPTDEYGHALEKLKGNQWFKVACKVAIAIGDDADRNVLADFTGNIESVITVHDVEQLKKIIHTVSVTSSMVNSKSSSVGTNTSSNGTPAPIADPTQQVIDVVQNDVTTDPTLNGVDLGNSTANSGTDDWDNW
jgi:uncharacterized protein YegL